MTDIPRDQHLFGPGPKRILALDGGGVRGALSVAILERIEALLDEHHGRPVLLADYFDLIGGTSTGAVIAAFLALGYRTADIKRLYLDLAKVVFRRPFWRIQGFATKFDGRALMDQLAATVGDRTLDSADLLTGLAMVTKRMDTGSAWVISNNPRAPYWLSPPDKSFIGNGRYLLAHLVRASTAAPHFFAPEILPIVDGEPSGLFVDGGLTPHNNPSLALIMLARARAFGLNWDLGPKNLTVISVGTGGQRGRLTLRQLTFAPPIALAVRALAGMIDDNQRQVLGLMQAMGECPAPWPINSEVGTLAGELLPNAPLFRFLRYDVTFEAPWLDRELGVTVPPADLAKTVRFDDPSIVSLVYDLGKRAAERQVKAEHICPQAP